MEAGGGNEFGKTLGIGNENCAGIIEDETKNDIS